MRFVQDRGRSFVDKIEVTGQVTRETTAWPELATVYGSLNWSVSDLIRALTGGAPMVDIE